MAKVKNRSKRQLKVPNKFSEDFDDDEDDITQKWYEEFPSDPVETAEVPETRVNELKSEAQKLLDGEVITYNLQNSRSSKQSDLSWMKTMVAGGTTSDKIAAYTLLVQQSPMHNLNILGNFINMVKLGKKECTMVIQTLTELFLTDLLPPSRKLRVFAACPLSKVDEMSSGNQVSRGKHLMRWYFEHQLKELYQEFLTHLNTAARDSIDTNKEKAVLAMYKLLSGNPEKESYLLTNLVNKLGDPTQKVASKTIYCLTQLLQNHPAMKGVILEEIEKLIFRSNISQKAQYYGVCFLSQFYLSSYDGDVAKNLIRIYFSFFKSCVKQGTVDTRMMRILLVGVNRAFPFVNKDTENQISEHVEMLYKIVHVANYNVSLHALCLIFQVADYSNSVSDRFYTALYRKLSDPKLATSSHHAMFLSLIFRALKKNLNIARGRAFIKRLLQVCEFLPAALSCGILFMSSQLIRGNKDMLAVKVESSKFSDEEEDEDECYKDAVLDGDDTKAVTSPVPDPDDNSAAVDEKPAPSSTWFHLQSGETAKQSRRAVTKYDGNHRNPAHAGGEHCAYTELVKLTTHYHPSVSVFAKQILEGKTVQYTGDPLQDFTLIRFLDRFVFKNPKRLTVQENLKPSPFARKKNYVAKGIKSLAVNSNSYLNETSDKIPVEELYMYQYLQRRRELGVKVNAEDDEGSDVDSVGSDDFNEMMDSLMGGKKEEQLDFADDVGDKLSTDAKKRKGSANKNKNDEDNESDESENDEEESDDEQDSGDDLEDGNDDGDGEEFDDDAEDIEFGEDGDDDEFKLGDDFNIDDISDMSDDDMLQSKKQGSKKKNLLAKFKGPNNSIFASADEFAEMLEESGASGLKMSGSSALANNDKAGEKQMKWEVSRNQWMGDEKWKGNKKRKRENTFNSSKFNKKSKKNKKS